MRPWDIIGWLVLAVGAGWVVYHASGFLAAVAVIVARRVRNRRAEPVEGQTWESPCGGRIYVGKPSIDGLHHVVHTYNPRSVHRHGASWSVKPEGFRRLIRAMKRVEDWGPKP